MKKQYWILIAIALILVGTIFYWYQYRPSQIISKCTIKAKNAAIQQYAEIRNGYNDGSYQAEIRDNFYKFCLQENGLTK